MEKQIDGCMDILMFRMTDRYMGIQTDEQVDWCMYGHTDGWSDWWKDRQIAAWANRHMNWCTDGRIDAWTDRRMNR